MAESTMELFKKALLNPVTIWTVRIAVIIGIVFFLKWLGWKGVLGIILGMASMAWLVLSANPLLMYLVQVFGGEHEAEKAKMVIEELKK